MKTNEEQLNSSKRVTFRNASSFGFQLANSLSQQLNDDGVPPSRWPEKFPITIKQINKIPEVNKSTKVAKRIAEAAHAMWSDMREQAIEIEKDMRLHPDYYDITELDKLSNNRIWRQLSIDIEQIAGVVFVTDFDNEDKAKENVYSILAPKKLKEFIIEFEDDYNDFISEVREIIRNKIEILASERFDLICLINANTQAAKKLIQIERKPKKIK